jgi:hypothetical protein
MITWYDYLIEAERHKNIIAEAEKERLIRQAVKHSSSPTKSYQRWLARLGVQLVSWGYRLQARYGQPLVISSALQQKR